MRSSAPSPTFAATLCAVLVVIAVEARALQPIPLFQDSGQVFGTSKGHFGRANAWGDLDGNGLLDVVSGGHDTGPLAYFQIAPLQFRRVDAEIGMSHYGTGVYGILVLDFDRDGDLDIVLNLVGFGDPPRGVSTLRYLRNNGQGRFADVTASVGFAENGHGFGLAALDFDKDGWVDIYVLNHRSANALYRNVGNGYFVNITQSAGVGGLNGRFGDSTGVTTLDYDRDGWTDLMVTQRDVTTAQYPFGNNLLFRNNGDGTFTNRALEAGVAGYSSDFVASTADFDNDGWPDLHLATFNFGMNGYPETDLPNRTYLNQGDGTFLDVTLGGGAAYVGGTMGLACDDADNDGFVDIYVGNGGPFLLQVEDQIFYRGLGDGRFVDQTAATGLTSDARGHGNTWIDVDRDGDLDLFASLGGHTEESRHKDVLYINLGPTQNSLEVQAIGTDCPLEGLGARVSAHAGTLTLHRDIQATGGFDSQRPPSAWFGLGQVAVLDSLVVHWPCGRRQARYGVHANDHLRILEANGGVSIFSFELLVRREAHDRVRVEVNGDLATLDPASLELTRRAAGTHSWVSVVVEWARQDDAWVAYDRSVPAGQDLHYRVRARLEQEANAQWITREQTLLASPVSRVWLRTAPNPFVDTVEFFAPALVGSAQLRIFDVRGREVRRLGVEEATSTGPGLAWIWDGLDAEGATVARGVYVAELRHDGRRVQRTFQRVGP